MELAVLALVLYAAQRRGTPAPAASAPGPTAADYLHNAQTIGGAGAAIGSAILPGAGTIAGGAGGAVAGLLVTAASDPEVTDWIAAETHAAAAALAEFWQEHT